MHGTDSNQVANQVFTITVSGVNNTGADYTMVLNQPVTHSSSGTEDNTSPFTVNVLVSDADGSTGNTSFTVSIDDDMPMVSVNDTFVYNAEGSLNTGTQSFHFGADGPASSGPLVLTSTGGLPDDYSLIQTGGANTWKAVLDGVSDPETDLFMIVMNPAQGTYTFTLLNDEPPVPVSVDIDQGVSTGIWRDVNGNIITSGDVYSSTIEPSGNSPFRIVASGTDKNGPAEISVINETMSVGGNDVLQSNDGDVFNLSFQNTTGQVVTFTSITMTLQHFDTAHEDFEITVTGIGTNGLAKTVTFFDGGPGVTIDGGPANSQFVGIDVSGFKEISTILTASTDGVLKVIDFDVNFTLDLNVSDQKYDFLATAKDGDLDAASDAFTVTVLAGTEGNDNLTTGGLNDTVSGGAGNDAISTGAGNDILTGGTGNDVLTGGVGNDTYKYNAANEGADTINGFIVGNPSSNANADVLDISELLAGAGISQATFLASPAAYLQVTPSGNTTISFDSDGGGSVSSPVLLVTLQGVNVDLATLLTNNEIKSS